jgi:signal peptidase I
MEHNQDFDTWWSRHEDYYLRYNVTRTEFSGYSMPTGFNKGDLILLVGTDATDIERGDIIVFWGGKAYPIIHRVVGVSGEDPVHFATKGDNNLGQIVAPGLDERDIPAWRSCREEADGQCDVLLGRAVLRIPWLGWVKIGFVNALGKLGFVVA